MGKSSNGNRFGSSHLTFKDQDVVMRSIWETINSWQKAWPALSPSVFKCTCDVKSLKRSLAGLVYFEFSAWKKCFWTLSQVWGRSPGGWLSVPTHGAEFSEFSEFCWSLLILYQDVSDSSQINLGWPTLVTSHRCSTWKPFGSKWKPVMSQGFPVD